MNSIVALKDLHESDRHRFGGKAVSLGRMIRAGLAVPTGFAIDDNIEPTDSAIVAALKTFNGYPVAVRSSAIGEDETDAAYPGIFNTHLNLHCEAELFAAIESVRRSPNASHCHIYQPGHRPLRMAVIIQQMVDPVLSGVVFTKDPNDQTGQKMIVTVQPGRIRLDGIAERCVIPRNGIISNHENRLLSSQQLEDLREQCLRIENVFGHACDVEWAIIGSQIWILQSRPISSSRSFGLDALRRHEIEKLRKMKRPEETVWVRYQLAESVPHPTPLTWSILQTMLSVKGGYGRMLRRLGFDPDPEVDVEGFVHLIAGQPYLDLRQEAKLDFRDLQYSFDVRLLRDDPSKALMPQRQLQHSFSFWRRLPKILWKSWRQSRGLQQLSGVYAKRLDDIVFPQFAESFQVAKTMDLATLSNEQLLQHLNQWRSKTLDEFASAALQPSVFATLALQQMMSKQTDSERESLLQELNYAISTDARSIEWDHATALRQLHAGQLGLDDFIATFGHRGPEELELAQSRWSEHPPQIDGRYTPASENSPKDQKQCPFIRRYCEAVALREKGRHYFMMGYTFLRLLALELDRRFELSGGVFFLEVDELSELIRGADVSERIRKRRRDYHLLRSLHVPTVLYSDDLDAIGRTPATSAKVNWTGHPISMGYGQGPAVVLRSPQGGPLICPSGFILVCPYVDAAWLPLIVRSHGVVLETGNDLTHGAILLREFGLPAAAGFPEILATIRTGDRIYVNGTTGTIGRIDPMVENSQDGPKNLC